jgi:hypothetical protein
MALDLQQELEAQVKQLILWVQYHKHQVMEHQVHHQEDFLLEVAVVLLKEALMRLVDQVEVDQVDQHQVLQEVVEMEQPTQAVVEAVEVEVQEHQVIMMVELEVQV